MSSNPLAPSCVARNVLRFLQHAPSALLLAASFAASSASAQTWYPPVPIAPTDLSVVQLDANVVMDVDGDAIAAWSQGNAGAQAAYQFAGRKWNPWKDLSDPASGVLGTRVAVGDDGTAVAVWVDIIATRYGRTLVMSATRPPGHSHWGKPQEISPKDKTVYMPQVAVDARGHAIAIWLHSDGTHTRVAACERLLDGTWTPPLDVSDASRDAMLPRLAISPLGLATAVWMVVDQGVATRIQGVTKSGFAPWSPLVDVSRLGTNLWSPQVAVDRDGRATVAWDENGVITSARQKLPGGPFLPPLALSDPAEFSGAPALAMDRAGNTLVAWQATITQPTSTRATKVTTRSADHDLWTAVKTLSIVKGSALEDVGPPMAAASPDGSLFVVTWEDNMLVVARAATWEPVARRVGQSKRWSDPVTLGASGVWDDPIPVAAGPNGTARAIWPGRISHYVTQLNAAQFEH